MVIQLFVAPLAVDHEDTARFDVVDHLEAFNQRKDGLWQSNKIRFIDVVRALDRLVAKTQMGKR